MPIRWFTGPLTPASSSGDDARCLDPLAHVARPVFQGVRGLALADAVETATSPSFVSPSFVSRAAVN